MPSNSWWSWAISVILWLSKLSPAFYLKNAFNRCHSFCFPVLTSLSPALITTARTRLQPCWLNDSAHPLRMSACLSYCPMPTQHLEDNTHLLNARRLVVRYSNVKSSIHIKPRKPWLDTTWRWAVCTPIPRMCFLLRILPQELFRELSFWTIRLLLLFA